MEPVYNRYILPSFVERTSYGIKESNPYNKMFEERIIFLGVQIDDASANDVMAQLLTLESGDPDRDITMYINSPGGSFTAMTAIYDTMQFVRPDIRRCAWARRPAPRRCCSRPARRASGWRCRNSRIIIHQPATEGGYGQGSDIEIQAREIMRMRTLLEDAHLAAQHADDREGQEGHRPGQDPDGREAKEYGLVDQVLASRKKTLASASAS